MKLFEEMMRERNVTEIKIPQRDEKLCGLVE